MHLTSDAAATATERFKIIYDQQQISEDDTSNLAEISRQSEKYIKANGDIPVQYMSTSAGSIITSHSENLER